MTNEARLFPPFRLDPGNVQLWRGKEEISLRPKTFDVLRYLVERPGQLVTKEALLDSVWPEVSVSDTMPANCVAELRKALKDSAKTPKFIETVHGRGYRFIADVTIETPRVASPTPRIAIRGPRPILVGREEELAQLQRWYADVLEGQRRVIFVAGEAGIGKSAFVQAFADSIVQKDALYLAPGQCVQHYGAGEPYMPVLEALSRLGRGHGGARIVEILNQFAPTWLAHMPELLTREERVRLQGETQGVTQQQMLREMTQTLEALAAQAPLVLILEDLHWSDFSTLELISAIARRSEPARLLIVGTYRPVEILAKDHPLRAMRQELELHHYCEELRLRLLSQENIVEYLGMRFSGDGSNQYATLAPVIHARTDGNPLFVINVVDYLLGKAGLAMRSPEVRELETMMAEKFDPPRSIREMIERNLERLNPEEQIVLEGASVAGPEFSTASVAAALERPLDEIEACCTRLSRQEQFLSAQGPITWPDGTVAAGFRFNHALYQEVLYGRLPAGHQLHLHRRIAAREEAGYGEQVGEVATELAHHYSRANDKNKAVEYFQLAAERATDRRAYREAEQHYRDALAVLLTLPESTERAAHELELRKEFNQVLSFTRGYSAPETVDTMMRTRDLAEKNGNLVQLIAQIYGVWGSASAAGEHVRAAALADQLLGLAEREGSHTSLAFAHLTQMEKHYYRGDPVEAEKHFALLSGLLETAIGLRQIPGGVVIALGTASFNAFVLGRADLARERIAQAVIFAHDSKNPYDLAFALFFDSWLSRWLKIPERVEAAAVQVLAISEKHGFPYCIHLVRHCMGWARAECGNAGEGVALISKGLAGMREFGARVIITAFLTCLAEAQALNGNVQDALGTIEEALRANVEELLFQPYMLTVRASLQLKSGRAELAEMDFREAISQARKQSAKTFELGATVGLAQLLEKQGKRHEARAMLAEIYSQFGEGFDTLALKEAKALLDELSAGTGRPCSR